MKLDRCGNYGKGGICSRIGQRFLPDEILSERQRTFALAIVVHVVQSNFAADPVLGCSSIRKPDNPGTTPAGMFKEHVPAKRYLLVNHFNGGYVKMKRRLLAALLALMIVISVIPTSAFAAANAGCAHENTHETYENATCTEPTKVVAKCDDCGKTVDIIFEFDDALGHTLVGEVIHTDPTCTKKGYDKQMCDTCGKAINVNTYKATEHDMVFVETVAPVCESGKTANGYDLYECANGCGETEQKNVVGWKHTPADVAKVPATCQTAGHEAGKECSVCGAILEGCEKIAVSKNAHNKIDKIVTPANCTTDGVKEVVCEYCEKSFGYESIPAAHTWKEIPVEVKDGDCETKGYVVKECAVCGATEKIENDEIKVDHVYASKRVPATCQDPAYDVVYCTVCEKELSKRTEVGEVDADAHNWELVTSRAATCTVAGKDSYKCANEGCEETKVEYPAALGHTFDPAKHVDVLATCTAAGYETDYCTVCKETFKNKLNAEGTMLFPKLDHEMVEEIEAATCLAAGSKVMGCKNCEYTNEETREELPKLGHSYTKLNEELSAPADCANDGKEAYNCVNGCTTILYKEIEAYDHNWVKVEGHSNNVAATCESTGKEVQECTGCKQVQVVLVAALGHNATTTPIPATCEKNAGYSSKCANGCTDKSVNFDYKAYKKGDEKYEEALGHDWDEGKRTPHAADNTKGYVVKSCKREGCDATQKIVDATLIHETKVDTLKEANCATGAQGITKTYCAVEGCRDFETKYDIVDAKHVFEGVEGDVTPGNCQTPPVLTKVCNVCKQSVSEDLEKTACDYSVIKTVAPTCQTEGYDVVACSVCGTEKGEKTNIKDTVKHSYPAEPTKVTEPTCTADGEEVYACIYNCGAAKKVTLTKTGHDIQKEVVGPTCTADGYTKVWCTNCDATNTTDPVKKLGHEYAPTVEVEATCVADGYKYAECNRCDHVYTVKTDAKDPDAHVLAEPVIKQEADCETGKLGVKYVECTLCDYEKYIDVMPEHDFATSVPESIVEPTCGTDGWRIGICSKCKYEEELVIPATGEHDIQVLNIPASCGVDQHIAEACTVCGHEEKVLETVPGTSLKHEWNEASTYPIDATCSSNAFVVWYCENGCGTEDYVEIPDTMNEAHEFEFDSFLGAAPTCINGSVAKSICVLCNAATKYEKVDVDPENHAGEFVDGDLGTTVCDACDAVVDPCAHEETVVLPAVASTCTEAGLTEGEACAICGETLVAQEAAELAPHTEKAIPAVEASCTETGLTEGTECSVCGEILKNQEATEMAAHTEKVILAVEATCTKTGLTEGTECSVCGEILKAQVEVAKAEHTEVAVEAVEATCTKEGCTAGTECSVCGELLSGCEKVDVLAHKFNVYKSYIYEKETGTYKVVWGCKNCEATKVVG